MLRFDGNEACSSFIFICRILRVVRMPNFKMLWSASFIEANRGSAEKRRWPGLHEVRLSAGAGGAYENIGIPDPARLRVAGQRAWAGAGALSSHPRPVRAEP